jgi:hypothetical protein
MKLPVAFTLALLCAVCSAQAQAQTVYRCGNAYAQSPCAEAKAIDVSDVRGTAQQTAASRVVESDRRLAAEMRRDRLADQAANGSARAASLGGAPLAAKPAVPVEHAAKKKKHASSKPSPTTDFIAYDPSSRKKARRRG